jgi:hypothetical protein
MHNLTLQSCLLTLHKDSQIFDFVCLVEVIYCDLMKVYVNSNGVYSFKSTIYLLRIVELLECIYMAFRRV